MKSKKGNQSFGKPLDKIAKKIHSYLIFDNIEVDVYDYLSSKLLLRIVIHVIG